MEAGCYYTVYVKYLGIELAETEFYVYPGDPFAIDWINDIYSYSGKTYISLGSNLEVGDEVKVTVTSPSGNKCGTYKGTVTWRNGIYGTIALDQDLLSELTDLSYYVKITKDGAAPKNLRYIESDYYSDELGEQMQFHSMTGTETSSPSVAIECSDGYYYEDYSRYDIVTASGVEYPITVSVYRTNNTNLLKQFVITEEMAADGTYAFTAEDFDGLDIENGRYDIFASSAAENYDGDLYEQRS